MNKLDSVPPSLRSAFPSQFDRGPTNRLIVLFPSEAGDCPSQSHRIWEIASSTGLNVLILSICNDPYEESQVRRQLVTMAALINDSHVCTDVKVQHGNDWVNQVKHVYQPGDMIACFAGQKVGLMRKVLHEVLKSQLEAPIFILAPDQSIENSRSKSFVQVAFWPGALVILGSFFWLQAEISQMPQDWAHKLLLFLCILVEFGLLLLWNSIFT